MERLFVTIVNIHICMRKYLLVCGYHVDTCSRLCANYAFADLHCVAFMQKKKKENETRSTPTSTCCCQKSLSVIDLYAVVMARYRFGHSNWPGVIRNFYAILSANVVSPGKLRKN